MGNWKSKDPLLIRTEIKVGSAILMFDSILPDKPTLNK